MTNIILIVITLLTISEIVTFFIYKGFLSKEETEFFMNLKTEDLKLNMYNASILNTNPFITNLPFSIFSKYYINGIGTVPRWSKLHKRINEYFIIALKNSQK